MKELNNKLDGLSELVTRIDAKILDINTKLDELIKALHEYDDENIQHCEYSGLPSVKMYSNEGYGELSFEAFKLTNDYISSFNVDGAERRTHHVTNEEADEDAANKICVGKDRDNNNTQDKRVDKKKSKRKYYKPKQTK